MKRKTKDQLVALSVAELKKKVTELRKAILEAKMKRFSTQIKNVRMVKELRIQVAVIKTALTAKLFLEGK